MTAGAKPAGAFRPVPTAVPPSGSSQTSGITARTRPMPVLTAAAYPPDPWPPLTRGAARCLSLKRAGQPIEAADQPAKLARGSQMHGGREHVVGRLGRVDVIVR